MRKHIKKLERYSLLPAYSAALVLFITLSILIPAGGNIVISAIISAIAFPIVFIFCLLACAFILKINQDSIIINYIISGSAGIILGLIGYISAEAIGNFSGTALAFILSGFVAGMVMQYQIKSNNQA